MADIQLDEKTLRAVVEDVLRGLGQSAPAPSGVTTAAAALVLLAPSVSAQRVAGTGAGFVAQL